MQKRRWVVSTVLVSLVAVFGAALGACGSRERRDPSRPDRRPACVARYAFTGDSALDPSLVAGGTCRPDGCGLNGSWLGRGIAFRELRLNNTTDNPDLRILSFTKDGQAYTFHVDENSDAVTGIAKAPLAPGRPGELKPETLVGAELRLGYISRELDEREEYVLRFERVLRAPFWARCPAGSAACRNTPAHAWLYKFSVTSARDGCVIELCKPGLDESYTRLTGTAVIFRGRGDVYDDEYTVNPAERATARDVVNIACTGTSISKLHLLRHTSASMAGGTYVSFEKRQAMLRLLAADYCGIGHPFTEDSVPVGIDLTYFDLVPEYTTDPRAVGTEAQWTNTRATCVERPRLLNHDPNANEAELRARINATCTAAGKPVPQPSCDITRPGEPPLISSRNP